MKYPFFILLAGILLSACGSPASLVPPPTFTETLLPPTLMLTPVPTFTSTPTITPTPIPAAAEMVDGHPADLSPKFESPANPASVEYNGIKMTGSVITDGTITVFKQAEVTSTTKFGELLAKMVYYASGDSQIFDTFRDNWANGQAPVLREIQYNDLATPGFEQNPGDFIFFPQGDEAIPDGVNPVRNIKLVFVKDSPTKIENIVSSVQGPDGRHGPGGDGVSYDPRDGTLYLYIDIIENNQLYLDNLRLKIGAMATWMRDYNGGSPIKQYPDSEVNDLAKIIDQCIVFK